MKNKLSFLAFMLLVIFTALPASAGIFSPSTKEECEQKYVPEAKTTTAGPNSL